MARPRVSHTRRGAGRATRSRDPLLNHAIFISSLFMPGKTLSKFTAHPMQLPKESPYLGIRAV